MSRTYQRRRDERALRRLAESSSSLMDYRSKLIFVRVMHAHPRLPSSVAWAWAETKAFWVTLLQRPLEGVGEARMKRRLRKLKRLTDRGGVR